MIKRVLKKLMPVPITLFSVYFSVNWSLEKYVIFIPEKHAFEISLLIYSTILSALFILLDNLLEKKSLKVTIIYSTDKDSFIANNKIHANFKRDTTKVFLKVIMDGSVEKLSNLDIRIVLPKKVKSQKINENSEYIMLNEMQNVITIPISNIISNEKIRVSAEVFFIPIQLIKHVEIVDSFVETTITKRKIQFVKYKFSKNKLKLL